MCSGPNTDSRRQQQADMIGHGTAACRAAECHGEQTRIYLLAPTVRAGALLATSRVLAIPALPATKLQERTAEASRRLSPLFTSLQIIGKRRICFHASDDANLSTCRRSANHSAKILHVSHPRPITPHEPTVANQHTRNAAARNRFHTMCSFVLRLTATTEL